MSAAASPATAPSRPRRSQQQRREASRRRLLDATTEVLIAQGYAGASVQAIVNRAGLSQGALFRHFENRLALMRAVANDIGDRLLERYIERFRALQPDADQDWLLLSLELLRDNCRSPLQQAWFELLMAARTDEALHQTLAPVWARNQRETIALAARLLPQAQATLGATRFAEMVDAVVSLFHGEAVDQMVRTDSAADAARLQWIFQTLKTQLATA
ncbi:MAG: TetR family transcriptional regulator [Algiphilus sp.]